MLRNKKFLKATIDNIVVAFLYTLLFFLILNLLFKDKITEITKILNLITVPSNISITKEISIDLTSNNLINYPEYGSEYANLKIPSLNIDLPVFFGDTLDIIKKGIGHSSGSYFPGEGGSILYMGHNTKDMLKDLKEIKNESEIIITTSYGTFTYTVYNTKVINYQNLEEVPINRDNETLMLYTCFNSTPIGHTPKRFIVYAKLTDSKIKGNEINDKNN